MCIGESLETEIVGTEERAQQARAHTALREDPSSIPSTYLRWLIAAHM